MGSLFYNNSKFIYEGQDGNQKVLLDCSCYLANKSRISMHRLPEVDCLTIPDLLLSLLEKEKEDGKGLEFPAALMDILLAARLIKTSGPVKVLEYGSMKGDLSLHLSEVLGAFHGESVLVCAYDTIEPEWMERMAQARYLPKLSYYAGDFGRLTLAERYFDIVVINGMVNYLQPEEVIADALRLVAEDGILICYADETPLLESTFKLYFEEREEYEITPSQKVMLAKAKDKSWEKKNGSDVDLMRKIRKDLETAEKLLEKSAAGKDLAEITECLKQDIRAAVKAERNDLKIWLIECMEKMRH